MGGERKQDVKKTARNIKVMKVERENIKSGWKGNRRFEGEGGTGVLHKQREDQMGHIEQWRNTSWRSRGSHSVGRCGISRRSRGAAPGVRAA